MHGTDAVYSYACPSVAMVCLSLCVSVTTVSRAEADKTDRDAAFCGQTR